MSLKKIIVRSIIALLFVVPVSLKAQQGYSGGQVHGSFQMDAQLYQADSLIGADEIDQKMLMNSFGNLIYTNGNFSAGMRFEYYLDPLDGFDKRLKGSGIPYRYVNYRKDKFDITLGNFYDQFGSGLVFRSYQEWNLGIDNSIDGIRVKVKPVDAVTIKGIYGKQRYYWEKSDGIVRGADAEIFVNDLVKLSDNFPLITMGGSMVSVFQPDDPGLGLNLPLNVAAMAGRLNICAGGFNFYTEYANKINDPNALNDYIYKNGEALIATASYAIKGLGVMASFKRLDNMGFKSQRDERFIGADVNFLPPITRQHAYNLTAMYPYSTQINGEIGFMGQVIYTMPKKSKLGGKYGTTISLNFSRVNGIDKQDVDSVQFGSWGYNSEFFKFGAENYFQDFNIEITKKVNKKIKFIASYMNMKYNIDVIEGHTGDPVVKANIALLDFTYKLTPRQSIRFEYQQLFTQQDDGDWVSGLLEYTVAPKWFMSAQTIYNYGNTNEDRRLNYYTFAAGYSNKTNRVSISYGKQRQGIVCVGGVCREVPASSGLLLTITSSF